MREIYRDIVCALIISADQKVLMGKKDRSSGGVYPDCWQIPGGGVEEHEEKITALRRELQEEVGLNLSGYPVVLLSDDDSARAPKKLANGEEVICFMNFFVYRVPIPASAAEISLKKGPEFAEIAWYTRDQIERLTLVPAGVRLFEKYGEQIFKS